MNKYILNSLLLIVAILPTKLMAQNKFQPYGYVQVQAGASTVFTNVDFCKRISPTATIGIGYAASPELGIRMNFNGWESKGGLKSIDQSYKHNYFDTDFDLLFNVFNIIAGYDSSRPVDLNLVAGIGMNCAWNGKIGNTNYSAAKENLSNMWGNGLKQTSFFGTQFRMGLAADYKLCKQWAVGAEVDMNTISDDFNAKCNNHNDWMLTAQVSLTYKFGTKKSSKPKSVVPAPVYTPSVESAPATQIVHDTIYIEKVVEKAPTAQPAKAEDKPLYEVSNFSLRGFETVQVAALDRVVEWCKAHPNEKIVVEGYADKGTGTAEANMYYSQMRADGFVNALKSKGVPSSQIEVKAMGDTVQPFAVNEQNRCVIVKQKN